MAQLEFCKVQNKPAYLVYAGDVIVARITCPIDGKWTVSIPGETDKDVVREVSGPSAAREYVQGYFDGRESQGLGALIDAANNGYVGK